MMNTNVVNIVIPVLAALSMAMPAFAQNTATTTIPTPIPARTPPRNTVALACVAAAVEKRENAIIAVFDAFSTNMKSAFMARRDALKIAWQIAAAPDRRTAINTAWRAFQDATRAARRAWQDGRTAAWRQFSTDRRGCGATPTGEDPNADHLGL